MTDFGKSQVISLQGLLSRLLLLVLLGGMKGVQSYTCILLAKIFDTNGIPLFSFFFKVFLQL